MIGITKERRYKCKYCNRTYKSFSAWIFKHFKKYHPYHKRAVKEIYVEIKDKDVNKK